MSQIKCPNCGHDLNPSESTNTRDTKAMRESLLNDWFDSLKKNGAWKSRVKESGQLNVKKARRELYLLEMKALGLPPEDDGMWDENYFKKKHWSYLPRTDFEDWVQAALSARPDRTLFGDPIGDLGIPTLMLESLNTPEEAMDVITKLAQEKQEALQEVKKHQHRINSLESTVLELRTRTDSMAEATKEEHHENSIRTLHYAAGMDIDLSLEELTKELREDSQG